MEHPDGDNDDNSHGVTGGWRGWLPVQVQALSERVSAAAVAAASAASAAASAAMAAASGAGNGGGTGGGGSGGVGNMTEQPPPVVAVTRSRRTVIWEDGDTPQQRSSIF